MQQMHFHHGTEAREELMCTLRKHQDQLFLRSRFWQYPRQQLQEILIIRGRLRRYYCALHIERTDA
jgi:hypothetical protein